MLTGASRNIEVTMVTGQRPVRSRIEAVCSRRIMDVLIESDGIWKVQIESSMYPLSERQTWWFKR